MPDRSEYTRIPPPKPVPDGITRGGGEVYVPDADSEPDHHQVRLRARLAGSDGFVFEGADGEPVPGARLVFEIFDTTTETGGKLPAMWLLGEDFEVLADIIADTHTTLTATAEGARAAFNRSHQDGGTDG